MTFEAPWPEGALVVEEGTVDGAVIFFHGLGADGHDFATLPRELGGTHGRRWVFPHAPRRPVTLNGGLSMRAWYDLYGLDRDCGEDAAGIAAMRAGLAALVESQRVAGIPLDRIVLGGFSQGAAMALDLALGGGWALGGVASLSGYLPLADLRPPAHTPLPVFIAHGRMDGVIGAAAAREACDRLRQLGHRPQLHLYDVGHGVCAEELADLSNWLNGALPPLPY